MRFSVKPFIVGLMCAGAVGAAANFQILTQLPNGTKLPRPVITDPEGYEFVPIGGNMNGYKHGWSNETLPHLDAATNVWKFNTIRLNCFIRGYNQVSKYWSFGDFKGTWNNNNDLDAIIKAYTSRKVAVMLEAHDWTGYGIDLAQTVYRDGKLFAHNDAETLENPFTELGGKKSYASQFEILVDFFGLLAEKYKNNPYVWFNPMNEPGTALTNYRTASGTRPDKIPDYWLHTHGKFVEAIRARGNNNIIVVDGVVAGQDHGEWYGAGANDKLYPNTSAILTHGEALMTYGGKQQKNILFSFHAYNNWGYTQNLFSQYIDYAHERGLALIIGEAGWYLDGQTSPAGKAFGWMWEQVPQRGVGVLIWHLQPGDGMALVNEGTFNRVNSSTNPTNLTWMGAPTWKITHEGINGIRWGMDAPKKRIIDQVSVISVDKRKPLPDASYHLNRKVLQINAASGQKWEALIVQPNGKLMGNYHGQGSASVSLERTAAPAIVRLNTDARK